ncbi:MAG: site-specific DNA-methyltransferase [Promethearchaeota archaeon Loki_b31]|nr:MAG: site-specific DNA-methyltransferase [Candidatus Lokiarchaeota archaeon Loki_b31]
MTDKLLKQTSIIKVSDEKKTHHKLIIGDAIEALKDQNLIKSKSIQTIITSPPYGLYKDYGGYYEDKLDLDKWQEFINKTAKYSKRILKDNGSFLINISPIPKNNKTKEIIPLDSIVYFIFKENGYFLRNKIIWHFNNMQNCVKRLSGRWEAILWFVKDINNYIFNLDDIRIPFITKKDKRLIGKEGRNPTDHWFFNRVNNMTKKKNNINHPCVYPDPMIERLIKMTTNEYDIVLDPFVGSGTTMRVSRILKRHSIGIELNPNYRDLIKRRLELDNLQYNASNFELINFNDI